jgi:hypothetical protein
MASMTKIGKYSTTVRKTDTLLSVVLYNTEVVMADCEKIVLNNGGWKTTTTKTRMNQAANEFNLPYSVHQEKGGWYCTTWNMAKLEKARQVKFNTTVTIDRNSLEILSHD